MPHRVRDVITVCGPIREPARNFWLPFRPFLGLGAASIYTNSPTRWRSRSLWVARSYSAATMDL